jgi:hypothetical protein
MFTIATFNNDDITITTNYNVTKHTTNNNMTDFIQQSNINYHYKKSWYYLTGKLEQKPSHFNIWSIWSLGHIGQFNLTVFNLTNSFFY